MHAARLGLLWIALTYLAVAGAETTFHRYIGSRDSPTARFLRALYFSKDQHGRPDVAHQVLLLIPAFALGIAAGICGATWPPRLLAACVVILALGQIALYPVYASCFPNRKWWTEFQVNPRSLG